MALWVHREARQIFHDSNQVAQDPHERLEDNSLPNRNLSMVIGKQYTNYNSFGQPWPLGNVDKLPSPLPTTHPVFTGLRRLRIGKANGHLNSRPGKTAVVTAILSWKIRNEGLNHQTQGFIIDLYNVYWVAIIWHNLTNYRVHGIYIICNNIYIYMCIYIYQ